MPKPFLREPYASLECDLIETMIAGLHEWRSDLDYPQSHSDLQGCVRAVLRMFEIKRRPIALERKEIEEQAPVCPACKKEIGYEAHSLGLVNGRELLFHPKCLKFGSPGHAEVVLDEKEQ